jgi:hypothetical protein
MDHWQTPVYSVQTYLHPLRRVAKPLRYYLIRICHGLFSHYTIPTVVENSFNMVKTIFVLGMDHYPHPFVQCKRRSTTARILPQPYFGRRCRIRTYDPLVPNQMRYQTAPISVTYSSF